MCILVITWLCLCNRIGHTIWDIVKHDSCAVLDIEAYCLRFIGTTGANCICPAQRSCICCWITINVIKILIGNITIHVCLGFILECDGNLKQLILITGISGNFFCNIQRACIIFVLDICYFFVILTFRVLVTIPCFIGCICSNTCYVRCCFMKRYGTDILSFRCCIGDLYMDVINSLMSTVCTCRIFCLSVIGTVDNTCCIVIRLCYLVPIIANGFIGRNRQLYGWFICTGCSCCTNRCLDCKSVFRPCSAIIGKCRHSSLGIRCLTISGISDIPQSVSLNRKGKCFCWTICVLLRFRTIDIILLKCNGRGVRYACRTGV